MNNIELGGGRQPAKNRGLQYKNYINLDIIKYPTVDVRCDLRVGIPFKDNIINNIYTCEFIEHLTYLQLDNLFRECYRVLLSTGTFYISCPNFQGSVEMLGLNKYSSYMIGNILGNGFDKYDYHRSLLWPELLIQELKAIGFSQVFDISEERLEEIRYDPELLNRGMAPEDFIKFKCHIRAIKL